MTPLISIGPKNLLDWSGMEDWVSGASAAPTEHTLSGSGASVAREATIVKRGTYSAALTRAAADAAIYTDLETYADYTGRMMTFGAWVYATVADRARISLGDDVGTTNSSYHTGDSTWQFLTVTRNIDTAAARIRASFEVNSGATTAYFDGGILVEGDTCLTDLSQYLEEFKPDKKYRESSFTIARRPGVFIPGIEHGEKSISLKGKVFGTTPTLARTAYDSMLKSFNGYAEKDLYLYDDRFYRAFISSESHDYDAALRCVKFSIKMTCQNPFSLYMQLLRNQQTISSSPTTFTVTNNGSAFTRPRIRFIAGGSDITSCTIENLTTGQTVTYTGTVTAGNTLDFDFDTPSIENNNTDIAGSVTGDFPRFRLDPGANLLKFTGSNCTIKVDYRERYL